MKKFFGQGAGKWVCGSTLALITSALAASAQESAVLAWDASPNALTVGYYLYYGTSPNAMTTVLNAGSNINLTVPNLQPGQTYYFAVSSYTANGTQSDLSAPVPVTMPLSPFLGGSVPVANGIDYLQFPDGNPFGYYAIVGFPWIYHVDLGYEYLIDANDQQGGVYTYDYTSSSFWYTNPNVFPYVYDFSLQSWLYYYPSTSQPGHYTSNPRYFYDFAQGKVITQ